MQNEAAPRTDERPPLSRDVSFQAMLATQFLGAFNDNLFKQLVLLLCVDLKANFQIDREGLAVGLFALPFVLFSGIAGWLSDRVSKRTIVVTMKVAEIGVMLTGFAALVAARDLNSTVLLLSGVLFLMGTHSAFFGPAKYGILPEMLRKRDLPAANGLIQMTTFLAIIFGWSLAGYTKDQFAGQLWTPLAICAGIAVIGTMTSLFVRRTPVAHAGLPFEWSALLIPRETFQMLRSDRALRNVLLVSSMFWFLGGAVQPMVNNLGRFELGLSDSRTSFAGAAMGVGIAVGCVASAWWSKGRIHFGLVRAGAWGLVGSLAGIALLGAAGPGLPAGQANGAPVAEPLLTLLMPRSGLEFGARVLLAGLGFFAGMFIVPLQVYMQARPPQDQKGRMIGAMNLINWVGIVLSAVFLAVSNSQLKAMGIGIDPAGALEPRQAHIVFWMLTALMLPIALLFRPPDSELTEPA